jgi:hypothetical protein
MQIITILVISLILIGWSSKPLFSHTDHHKTEIKQETKEHSEHHNQIHPKNQTKPVILPSSSLQISATNTDNLQVKPEELIFLLLIASPFLLHLLKNKIYNHE